MSWHDWISYPGASQDHLIDQMASVMQTDVEQLGRVMESVTSLAKTTGALIEAVKAQQEHINAIEDILRVHGLAK